MRPLALGNRHRLAKASACDAAQLRRLLIRAARAVQFIGYLQVPIHLPHKRQARHCFLLRQGVAELARVLLIPPTFAAGQRCQMPCAARKRSEMRHQHVPLLTRSPDNALLVRVLSAQQIHAVHQLIQPCAPQSPK